MLFYSDSRCLESRSKTLMFALLQFFHLMELNIVSTHFRLEKETRVLWCYGPLRALKWSLLTNVSCLRDAIQADQIGVAIM